MLHGQCGALPQLVFPRHLQADSFLFGLLFVVILGQLFPEEGLSMAQLYVRGLTVIDSRLLSSGFVIALVTDHMGAYRLGWGKVG